MMVRLLLEEKIRANLSSQNCRLPMRISPSSCQYKNDKIKPDNKKNRLVDTQPLAMKVSIACGASLSPINNPWVLSDVPLT